VSSCLNRLGPVRATRSGPAIVKERPIDDRIAGFRSLRLRLSSRSTVRPCGQAGGRQGDRSTAAAGPRSVGAPTVASSMRLCRDVAPRDGHGRRTLLSARLLPCIRTRMRGMSPLARLRWPAAVLARPCARPYACAELAPPSATRRSASARSCRAAVSSSALRCAIVAPVAAIAGDIQRRHLDDGIPSSPASSRSWLTTIAPDRQVRTAVLITDGAARRDRDCW
jgi:hypothetical protein